MKINRRLVMMFAFLLFACQPKSPRFVTILYNEKAIMLQTEERVPSALLSQARISLGVNDRILVNGSTGQLNQPIPHDPITLQIRRAINILINTPQGQKQMQSSAFTVAHS